MYSNNTHQASSLPRRTDLWFESEGARCAATLTVPPGSGPHPGVLVVHGFTCDRTMRLGPYVDTLTAHGFAVLTYDPRHIGDSEGEPRQLVDPQRLVADAAAALALLRTAPCVGDFVAVLSFSFGGGVAMSLAPDEGAIGALAHVVGFVAANSRGDEEVGRLFEAAGADLAAAQAGASPVMIDVCGAPGSLAVLTAPDALAGRDLLDERGAAPNYTPARSLVGIASFAPAERAPEIGCPTLFVVCNQDHIVDPNATRAVADAMPSSTVIAFDGSHFDVFEPARAGEFARTVAQYFDNARPR